MISACCQEDGLRTEALSLWFRAFPCQYPFQFTRDSDTTVSTLQCAEEIFISKTLLEHRHCLLTGLQQSLS